MYRKSITYEDETSASSQFSPRIASWSSAAKKCTASQVCEPIAGCSPAAGMRDATQDKQWCRAALPVAQPLTADQIMGALECVYRELPASSYRRLSAQDALSAGDSAPKDGQLTANELAIAARGSLTQSGRLNPSVGSKIDWLLREPH